MKKRNILLVCDQRDMRNWGLRSSGIALGQILGFRGNVDTLSRDLAIKRHPVGPLRSYIRRGRHGRTVSRAIRKSGAFLALYRLAGGRDDYVFRHPAKTLALFNREVRRGDELLAEVQRRFEGSGCVVVNGGDTLMLDYPPRRELLFQLFAVELAASLGKPVYYMNGMTGEGLSSGNDPEMLEILIQTLSKCRTVTMRDPQSMDQLAGLGLGNIQWYPDALFSWRTRYASLLDSGLLPETPDLLQDWPESDEIYRTRGRWPSDYLCLSAAAVPGARSSGPERRRAAARAVSFYAKLIAGLKDRTGMPVIVVDPYGDELLKPLCEQMDVPFVPSTANLFAGTGLLAGARAFVGGRYHPAVLASLGGTPCTFLQCATRSADRLLNVLDHDVKEAFPVDEAGNNIQAIIEHTVAGMEAGDTLRKKLVSQAHKNSYKVKYGLCSSLNNPL
jgi:hypothetical protein